MKILPGFIQLLNDDIVALTELTLKVQRIAQITRLALSLYLKTRCQLKLRHSVKSVAETLDKVRCALKRRKPAYEMLDRLTLHLTERMIMEYICDTSL